MGLIKTAMMCGAAMYGINKLGKTLQSRQSNSPPPRREYSGRDYDSYRARPLEFRDPDPRELRYVDVPDYQGHEREHDARPGQWLYLADQPPHDDHAYYMPPQYDDQPQYENAANMRSSSAPSAQYYAGNQYQRQRQRRQGFVEPEEIVDDPRVPQDGSISRADMVSMLAQRAMAGGLVGGKKGKKDDQDGMSDLLSGLIGR